VNPFFLSFLFFFTSDAEFRVLREKYEERDVRVGQTEWTKNHPPTNGKKDNTHPTRGARRTAETYIQWRVPTIPLRTFISCPNATSINHVLLRYIRRTNRRRGFSVCELRRGWSRKNLPRTGPCWLCCSSVPTWNRIYFYGSIRHGRHSVYEITILYVRSVEILHT